MTEREISLDAFFDCHVAQQAQVGAIHCFPLLLPVPQVRHDFTSVRILTSVAENCFVCSICLTLPLRLNQPQSPKNCQTPKEKNRVDSLRWHLGYSSAVNESQKQQDNSPASSGEAYPVSIEKMSERWREIQRQEQTGDDQPPRKFVEKNYLAIGLGIALLILALVVVFGGLAFLILRAR